MTWRYVQRTGALYDPDGAFVARGYSGHGPGINNPAMQHVRAVGPIPCGQYSIGDPLDPPDHLGPLAMPLMPADGNEMFGRSAFFMHGDNSHMNHTASDGCLIFGPGVRAQVNDSDDDQLVVVAEEGTTP